MSQKSHFFEINPALHSTSIYDHVSRLSSTYGTSSRAAASWGRVARGGSGEGCGRRSWAAARRWCRPPSWRRTGQVHDYNPGSGTQKLAHTCIPDFHPDNRLFAWFYRDRLNSMQILLSRTQSQAEQVSKSREKFLPTTYRLFSRSLYI